MAPPFWRTLQSLTDEALGRTGALVDKLAVDLALEVGRSRKTDDSQAAAEAAVAALDAVADAHASPALYAPGGFFGTPPEAHPHETLVRTMYDGGRVVDWTVDSGFTPFAETERESYLAWEENRVASARAFLHPEPRAAIVLVHGYLGGHFGFEEAAFPVPRLYARGLDVVLVTLPFHGTRTPPRRTGMWPSRNPWWAVAGFGQAVWDLARWRDFLKARGSSRVGLFAMSLGSYTSALTATATEGWDFLVPMIPLASLADAYHEHRARQRDAPPPWLRGRIEAAYRVISPFSRPSTLDPASVLVLAAEGDQITPVDHARRLARHFGATMETFPGGHLFQAGRGRAFAAAERLLERRGLLAPT